MGPVPSPRYAWDMTSTLGDLYTALPPYVMQCDAVHLLWSVFHLEGRVQQQKIRKIRLLTKRPAKWVKFFLKKRHIIAPKASAEGACI